MTFWDKAKKVVDQAADSVNREAKSASKQYEISKIEGEIDRQYVEMGKRAHELYGQRELLDSEIGVIAKRIAALEVELEEGRRAVQDLRHPGRTAEATSAPAPEEEGKEAAEPEIPS